MLRPSDRARLEGILDSDDPKVTPADRIRAIDLLAQHGQVGANAAHVKVTEDVMSLSGAQLDEALEAYMAPLPTVTGPPIKSWRAHPDSEDHEGPLAKVVAFARGGHRPASPEATPQDAQAPGMPQPDPRATPARSAEVEEAKEALAAPRAAPPGLDPAALPRQARPDERPQWPPPRGGPF